MDEQDQGFREQLEERIANYRTQRARIRTRLVELNHDLLDFDRRLDAAEELYRREFGLPAPGAEQRRSSTPSSGRTNDAQPSWRDAIVGAIRAKGRPLHVKEIWEALLENGFHTESRDPLRSIVAIAVRDPNLKRTAPNTYGLDGVNGTSQQMSIGSNTAASQEGEEQNEHVHPHSKSGTEVAIAGQGDPERK